MNYDKMINIMLLKRSAGKKIVVTTIVSYNDGKKGSCIRLTEDNKTTDFYNKRDLLIHLAEEGKNE